MNERRPLSTTTALCLLLLPLLCLPPPAAAAVNCSNITREAILRSSESIVADCVKEDHVISYEKYAQLTLDRLNQSQLNEFLGGKKHIQMGIHMSYSTVERFESGVTTIVMKDYFLISFNLKLKSISLPKLKSMTTTESAKFYIAENPQLTTINIPAQTVSVPISVASNGRLDQAGLDKLKGAAAADNLVEKIHKPGECEIRYIDDAAYLDGCHINKGSIYLRPHAKQSATWDDVKLHVEGCLEIKDTELTTLDFLKDAPEGCSDPVITGNKQLCNFGPLNSSEIDTSTNCEAKCFKDSDLARKNCTILARDVTADFEADKNLTRGDIERLTEANGALAIKNYPEEQLTINLQKVPVPSGATQVGLAIEGAKLKKLDFKHKIAFEPKPAEGTILLQIDAPAWSYTQEDVDRISAASGIKPEQMRFNGRVPTTPSPPTSTASSASQSSDTWTIVFCSVGGAVLLLAVIGGAVIWWIKKGRKQKADGKRDVEAGLLGEKKPEPTRPPVVVVEEEEEEEEEDDPPPMPPVWDPPGPGAEFRDMPVLRPTDPIPPFVR